MDRKKERYLVALRASVKGTGLLKEIKTPREDWVNAGKNRLLHLLLKVGGNMWWCGTARLQKQNKKERESKVIKAEEELNAILGSIENGEITSRSERDEKIGYVKRKYQVTRYLHTKGNNKGFNFTIEKTKALDEVEKHAFPQYSPPNLQPSCEKQLNRQKKQAASSRRAKSAHYTCDAP